MTFDIGKLATWSEFLESMSGDITFDGHIVDLDDDAWKQYLLWELTELEFRDNLITLDLLIRHSHPKIESLRHIDPSIRLLDIFRCWGGSSFAVKGENALCSDDARKRWAAIRAFYDIVSLWPQSATFLPSWAGWREEGKDDVPSDPKLETLESEVWKCYGQVSFDYRHEIPGIPRLRPPVPWR